MSNSQNGKTPAPEENSKRQERAQRILDAASELIQRWGYRKTTIDDIAKQAGVAKGTIYLHWKTREELFMALILRERLNAGKQLAQQLADTPDGGTLHAIIKYATLAALQNPLLKALMIRDTDMLGELARSHSGELDIEQRTASSHQLINTMRDKGLVRTDISLEAQIYMLSAIATGFIVVDQFLPDRYILPQQEAMNLLAETIQRTFEERQPSPPEQQEMVVAFDHVLEDMRDRHQEELGQ